jgi:hypothetical protein
LIAERDGKNAEPRTRVWTELRNWTSRNVDYNMMTVQKYLHTEEDLKGPFKDVLEKVDVLRKVYNKTQADYIKKVFPNADRTPDQEDWRNMSVLNTNKTTREELLESAWDSV